MSGQLWNMAFPLVAIGLRAAGVTVIGRCRHQGKTAELIQIAKHDPHALIVVSSRAEAIVIEAREDWREAGSPAIIHADAMDGWEFRAHFPRPPIHLYVDNAEMFFPAMEQIDGREVILKAVTYSRP